MPLFSDITVETVTPPTGRVPDSPRVARTIYDSPEARRD